MKKLIYILIFNLLNIYLVSAQCLTPTYIFNSTNGVDGFRGFITIDGNGAIEGTITHGENGVNLIPDVNGTGLVDGTDTRIYKPLGRSLNDSIWKAECKFNLIKGRSPGHVLMALSAGTAEVFGVAPQKSIYIVIHRADLNNFPASGTYVTGEYDIASQGTAIVVYYKDINGTQFLGSTPINIEPNEVGKLLGARLEKLGTYNYRFSKLNADGSEISTTTFTVNEKLTGLNAIQMGGNSAGWGKRTLTANFNDYVIYEPNCSSHSISGVVHQGNSYLNGGKITAINTVTKKIFSTYTNKDGTFKFDSLEEGNYKIKALAFDGEDYFSTYYPNTIDSSKADILVLVGSINDLDLQMESKSNFENISVQDLIKVGPNPFDDELNLKLLLNKAKNAEICLLNSYGQVILNFDTKNIELSTINTKNLKSGMYFLKIKVDSSTKVINVFKQ